MASDKRVTLGVGLLILLLAIGCETKCKITCADGFKSTFSGSCPDDLIAELSKDHGTCTGDD